MDIWLPPYSHFGSSTYMRDEQKYISAAFHLVNIQYFAKYLRILARYDAKIAKIYILACNSANKQSF